MENENPVDSNAQDSVKGEDKVSYESYRKTLDEAKREREKRRELESQLESLRTKELEEKQQWQTLADDYKKKFQQTQEELAKERETRKWEMVTTAIKSKAQAAGCVDPDKLIKIFDKSDFELLQAEQGKIKDESLSMLIDKAKKENPFFFNSQQVRINDALPKQGQADSIDVSKMSREELAEYIKTKFAK